MAEEFILSTGKSFRRRVDAIPDKMMAILSRFTVLCLSAYFVVYFLKSKLILFFPVGWGNRMHRLHLCRGVKPPMSVLVHDTKKSDGEVPVELELWGMQSSSSLPSLLGPLWAGVVTHDRVLSMGQIELNCVLMLNWIAWNGTVLMLNWTV